MPCLLPFLKFVIGHIARYAPSSKSQNQQKYRSKLVNLFFHHYIDHFEHLPILKTQRIQQRHLSAPPPNAP